MKILVLGKGFLGQEFERQGFEVWGKERFEFDIIRHEIKNFYASRMFEGKFAHVDAVVNCIAKSNTRDCEMNFHQAMAVNGHLPAFLSKFCKERGIKFVHISTGCLYDHDDATENDFITAHCNYTVTKWIGEKGCDSNYDLILRPRLLYSDVQDRNNLLCKLPKFKHFVWNRVDSLTSTRTIVEATLSLLRSNQSGIFNVANSGKISMHSIANLLDLPNKNSDITMEQLRNEQKLYLVNSTMRLNKLQKFYNPPTVYDELIRCWMGLLNRTARKNDE